MIPFLTADHACSAFQLPAYAEHCTCYAVDLRGSGATLDALAKRLWSRTAR
jgi:hypothetical protein